MHDMLTQFMLAQIGPQLLGVWSSVWPYLAMLGGFSLIVFVHELGHFAVAKWAGVRVERFAIGFGKELFGFTRGETRYSFNVLPLGGYVKMLGQEDFDDKSQELRFKDDPRSFINKPVGHRMAIVSAGVIMNIIFACLAFMIVFLIGMEAPPPRIAGIEPDSPAEKAGLLPGDVIKEVNGEKVLEFNEVRFAVLLAPPHEPIQFVVERDGALMNFDIIPKYSDPPSTRSIQRLIVGISPAVSGEIVAVGPEIQPDNPSHPKVGDKIIEVDGVTVTDANASGLIHTLPYAKDIYVERKDPKNPDKPAERLRVEIPPLLALYPSDPNDSGSVNVLGLTPLARFHLVDPRGRAHLAGIDTGDTILSWNDIAYPSAADVARAIRDNAEWDVAFTVQKADGRPTKGFVRPKAHPKAPATIQADLKIVADAAPGAPQTSLALVRPQGSAARAGLEDGDLVLRAGDVDFPTRAEVRDLIQKGTGKLVPLTVRKKDGRELRTVVETVAAGSIDATYNLVADQLLRTGEPLALLNGKPSPAAEAKIPAGARIVAVNGQKVSKWRELIEALRAAAGTTASLVYSSREGGEQETSFRVPHSLHTLLGIGPEARIISIDNREMVTLESSKGTDSVSVGYHEGTRAILRELVGRQQVPVQFRATPLAPIQTASIDVTEEVVDPWLSRVAFSPSIEVDEAKKILRGENAGEAVWIGLHKTYYFVLQVYKTMERMIFTRSLGVESVSGPLGIIDMGGKVAQAGLVKFLFFLAIISANLAVINFLPLPIVDGGLMVFLIIEKIKGSPVSIKVQVATQVVGLFLIIGAFLFVTYQDALRLWG